MYCLFCIVLCIVCVYMCTVLLPPGDNPVALNKYIIIIILYGLITQKTVIWTTPARKACKHQFFFLLRATNYKHGWCVKAWTGFIWLGMGFSGGMFGTQLRSLGFHTRWENVWIAERLSVSQELYYHTLAKLLYKQ